MGLILKRLYYPKILNNLNGSPGCFDHGLFVKDGQTLRVVTRLFMKTCFEMWTPSLLFLLPDSPKYGQQRSVHNNRSSMLMISNSKNINLSVYMSG